MRANWSNGSELFAKRYQPAAMALSDNENRTHAGSAAQSTRPTKPRTERSASPLRASVASALSRRSVPPPKHEPRENETEEKICTHCVV